MTTFFRCLAASLLFGTPLASHVAADTWQLPFEGPICDDCFFVSADGSTLVVVERDAEQPEPVKGPPRPENGKLYAYSFATGQATWLGNRNTTRAAWPEYAVPGPGGRFVATDVVQLVNPSDPTSAVRHHLYVTDVPAKSAKRVASDVDCFLWDPSDGSLLVSFKRDEDYNTVQARRYDPTADSWSDTGVFGTCFAVSRDGRTRLFRVNLDSIEASSSLLSETPARQGLAVLDASGKLLREFGLVDHLVGRPALSADGRFVASIRAVPNVPSAQGTSVVMLSTQTGARSEIPGAYRLLGVTSDGKAVTLDDSAVGEGGRLQVVHGSGTIDVVEPGGVLAAALVGDREIRYVAAKEPKVIRSAKIVVPRSLFAPPEGGDPPVMTEDEYLDSISFDNYLESLNGIDSDDDSPEPPTIDDIASLLGPSPDGTQVVGSSAEAGPYVLSGQQREVERRFGAPSIFSIQFLEQAAGEITVRCRVERWVYPAARTEFSFLDGKCIGTKQLEPRDYARTVVQYRPAQFSRGMTPDEIKTALGLDELKPMRLEDRGIEHPELQRVSLFGNHDLLLGFADGRLVMVQCFARPLPKP